MTARPLLPGFVARLVARLTPDAETRAAFRKYGLWAFWLAVFVAISSRLKDVPDSTVARWDAAWRDFWSVALPILVVAALALAFLYLAVRVISIAWHKR